jgi:O-antigen/teichoic acid export membrane protein
VGCETPAPCVRNLRRNRAALGALAASLASQGILVVSGLATARLLGVTGRGELAILIVVATIAGQLGAAGLPTAVAYTLAGGQVSAHSVLRMLARTWVVLCVTAGAASGGAVVLISQGTRSASVVWVQAALVAVWVVSLMNGQLLIACLQGERRFRSFNLLRPLPTGVSAAALLCLLLFFHNATVSTVLAILVAASVMGCAVGSYVVVRGRKSESTPATLSVHSLLRYGLASFVGANAPLESLSVDQAAVGLLLSRQQLGLYVVGTAFNNLPSLLVFGLGTVALPEVTSERDPAARRRLMRDTAAAAIFVAAVATLGAELVVAPLLPFVFGSGFAGAIPVARVLIIAGFFLSLRRLLVVFLQADSRPGQTSVGEFVAFTTLVLLAVVLVPRLGIMGAGVALVVAALVADLYLVLALRRGWSGGKQRRTPRPSRS